MSNAVTSTGILVYRNGVAIAEVTEVTPGGPMRNKLETSEHEDGYESHRLGILRQNDPGFRVNFIAGNSTHMAMMSDLHGNFVQSWMILYPSGIFRTGQGYVQSIVFDPAPVDGKQGAAVTLAWAGQVTDDVVG